MMWPGNASPEVPIRLPPELSIYGWTWSRVSPGLCSGEQLTQRAFLKPRLSQGTRPQLPGCQAGTSDSLSVSIAPL
ncbi:hypothetical protein CapIbe_009845 [Capra ibex]